MGMTSPSASAFGLKSCKLELITMEREYKTMRFLKRCEFWSFTIAALSVVWWLAELYSSINS